MSVSYHLEDFGAEDASAAPLRTMSEEALEDHRLAAFEQGYSAGWEDAMAAQVENRTRISAALGQSLEDLSFTYSEVRAQVLDLVEPVFESLIAAILPAAMMRVLGHRIVEELCALTSGQIEQPVMLMVSAGEAAGVRQIVSRDFALPVEVREDRDLEPGTAIIRVGAREHELDGNEVIASIERAVTSFFQSSKDSDHG